MLAVALLKPGRAIALVLLKPGRVLAVALLEPSMVLAVVLLEPVVLLALVLLEPGMVLAVALLDDAVEARKGVTDEDPHVGERLLEAFEGLGIAMEGLGTALGGRAVLGHQHLTPLEVGIHALDVRVQALDQLAVGHAPDSRTARRTAPSRT